MISDFWMGFVLGCSALGIIVGALATKYIKRIEIKDEQSKKLK